MCSSDLDIEKAKTAGQARKEAEALKDNVEQRKWDEWLRKYVLTPEEAEQRLKLLGDGIKAAPGIVRKLMEDGK